MAQAFGWRKCPGLSFCFRRSFNMPTVIISLVSQRSKPVTDTVTWVQVRGRLSGLLHPSDVVLKPDSAEIVMDLIPDRYTIEVEVPGFEPTKGTFDIGLKPLTLSL